MGAMMPVINVAMALGKGYAKREATRITSPVGMQHGLMSSMLEQYTPDQIAALILNTDFLSNQLDRTFLNAKTSNPAVIASAL